MVKVLFDSHFEKAVSKINNASIQKAVKEKILKITENPRIGKPMRFGRKGTRELYIGSFRISYEFHESDQCVEFLDLYHKDEQ